MYVCKYFKLNVGHPVINVGEPCQGREAMLQKEGLTKCCILSLQRLYHPVLPYRCNGRLMFCLCRSVATECNTDG